MYHVLLIVHFTLYDSVYPIFLHIHYQLTHRTWDGIQVSARPAVRPSICLTQYASSIPDRTLLG